MPIIINQPGSGGSGASYPEVNTFTDLPSPPPDTSKHIYIVLTATGSWYTFNRKDSGLYYWNGSTWSLLDQIPYYFSSTNFRIQDGTDATKQLAFDVSALITGTTRTITIPNANVNLTNSYQAATASNNGYLSSSDWTTFNNKQASINGTGFVKASGTSISYDNSSYFVLPSLTSGSVLFSNGTTISQDNSNFFWDSTNYRLGIGLTSPLTGLHISETGTSNYRGSLIDQYNAGTQGARQFLRKSRGTAASPNTTIVSGDILGTLLFSGNEGTAFNDSAGIRVTSVGTIGTNRVPSKMELMVSTDVSTSVLTTALTIDQTTSVTINSSTATTSSSTGALIVTGGAGIGGSLYANNGVDSTHILGRLRIDSRASGSMYISHSTNTGTTKYTLKDDTNNTTINASGGDLSLAINNSILAKINLSAFTVSIRQLINWSGPGTSTDSTNYSALVVGNTFNGTSLTGVLTGIIISPFYSTGTTGATKIVADLGINSANGGSLTTHTSYFKIDNTGLSTFNGIVQIKRGLASTYAKVGGVIFDHFADAGNSGTTRTDLYSDTIDANCLGTNGDEIEFNYTLTLIASGTATREIWVNFAGTDLYDSGALTISAPSFGSATISIKVIITRDSSTSIRYDVTATTNGATTGNYCDGGKLTGLTLSNTNVLKISGQSSGVGAATNDIVAIRSKGVWKSAA